jgi:beta-glucosidase
LRNEWGFVGFVETDAATGLYMRDGNARAEAVIAGNDLWLRGTKTESELWGDYKNSPTVCQALRESAHRLLYTVCNSAAMNGIGSNTRYVYVQPWYFGVIQTAQLVVGILTGVCLLMTVLSFVLPVIKKRKNIAQANK